MFNQNFSKKYLFIGLAILIAGLLLFIGLYFYNQVKQPTDLNLEVEKKQITPSDKTTDLDGKNKDTVNENNNSNNDKPGEYTGPWVGAEAMGMDQDADGLYDFEEEQIGTDFKNPDTDADGLDDYYEVRIYKTNPLNPDTDVDGHKDGDEVKNGFNPNGQGKLKN